MISIRSVLVSFVFVFLNGAFLLALLLLSGLHQRYFSRARIPYLLRLFLAIVGSGSFSYLLLGGFSYTSDLLEQTGLGLVVFGALIVIPFMILVASMDMILKEPWALRRRSVAARSNHEPGGTRLPIVASSLRIFPVVIGMGLCDFLLVLLGRLLFSVRELPETVWTMTLHTVVRLCGGWVGYWFWDLMAHRIFPMGEVATLRRLRPRGWLTAVHVILVSFVGGAGFVLLLDAVGAMGMPGWSPLDTLPRRAGIFMIGAMLGSARLLQAYFGSDSQGEKGSETLRPGG